MHRCLCVSCDLQTLPGQIPGSCRSVSFYSSLLRQCGGHGDEHVVLPHEKEMRRNAAACRAACDSLYNIKSR